MKIIFKIQKERWKVIPGWPDYKISSFGRVASKRPLGRPNHLKKKPAWRLLKGWMGSFLIDYPMVTLSCPRRGHINHSIHHLILLAFVGPPEHKQEARHLDDVKTNSVLSNLAWGTRSENLLDSVRNGRHGGMKTSTKLKGRPRSPSVVAKLKEAWVKRKASGWTYPKRRPINNVSARTTQ